MKYAWIDGQRRAYPLPAMCATLSVSMSGYQAWKRGGTPHRKRLTDAQMLVLIRAIHAEFKGAYGSPRMTEGRLEKPLLRPPLVKLRRPEPCSLHR